jgi:spore coat protein U-like protein
MRRAMKFSIPLMASILVPQAALATNATTTMGISATVLSACVVTANSLAFGNYNPTSATATDATATFDVLCTAGTSYSVGLNAGTKAGATVTTRQMSSGANALSYSLYSDSGRNTNWGNTPGTDTPSPTTAGVLPSTFTVYGRIPAQQNVQAGSYTDTVTITVSY